MNILEASQIHRCLETDSQMEGPALKALPPAM